MRISLVLWDGFIGGAERFTVSLAGELRRRGVDAGVVIVGPGEQLRVQLQREEVPAVHLGFSRGATVVRHPRVLRDAVDGERTTTAIIQGFGYLGATLRLGGFRRSIIGVEHGVLISIDSVDPARRLIRGVDRRAAALTHDAEVAVSAFMERLATAAPHCRRLVRIPHGIRMDGPPPDPPSVTGSELRIGYVGRLFPGKGLDVLLRALALLQPHPKGVRVTLTVAGEGPTRESLEALARKLDVSDLVTFVGWTDDVAEFWSGCHLAVAPNDLFVESFCMAIAEAMTCARPTVVTSRGALPELVVPDVTGAVVRGGDANALAAAISRYVEDPDLLAVHGRAARGLAEEKLRLDRCADRYLDLARTLARGGER